MTRPVTVLAALGAAALIAGCGGSDEPDSKTDLVRPELPLRTTTVPTQEDEPTPQDGGEAPKATAPAFDGPVVKVRIKNGLCTPDSPAAPANKKFQLRIVATDRPYELVFDGKRRFSVPKGATGRYTVAGQAPDEPVLTIFGEPCAVIRIR